jgi:uncharacterized Fe-S cluster-containing radical SAM superfamily enzyme
MASRAVTAERVDWAVRRLMECRSTTTVVAELADHWGVSRRTAQRLVGKAHQVLVDDLENAGVDRHQMLSQLVHALQESIGKALASNQPAAAVAACRAIAEICQLSTPPRRP